ncbi:MAG: DUF1156 domain-containing protein [bacterium]
MNHEDTKTQKIPLVPLCLSGEKKGPQSVTYPKRLIEVDLPIKRISAHARREKSIRHGHISTLHIWWARRPLAACRAVICAALWPDPADDNCPPSFRTAAAKTMEDFAKAVQTNPRMHKIVGQNLERWITLADQSYDVDNPAHLNALRHNLLDFIGDFSAWEASTEKHFLDTARKLTQAAHEALGGEPGTKPLVVDPFAGGGSIPLEALRVGADAFASDLNPVAVLINKVVLEYIPKYGQRLADEVRKWGEWIKKEAERELAEFYPKDPDGSTPIAYMWARTITCEGPGCGAEVPLMRSLWLAKKRNPSVAMRIIPNPKKKRINFEFIENVKATDVGEGTIHRGAVTCPVCSYTTPVASVRAQMKERRGGAADARLFAVVTTGKNKKGRFYRLPIKRDLNGVEKAKQELERRRERHKGELSLVPDEDAPPQGALSCRNAIYGLNSWGDLFMPRQALALTTLVRLIQEVKNKVETNDDKSFAIAVQTCLAFVLNKVVDRCNALARWEPNVQCPQQLFGRQANGVGLW